MSKAPFHVRGLDHVVLRVVDLDRSIAFYESLLDATVERRNDELGLVQLRVGAHLVDLVPVDGKIGKLGGAAPGTGARNMDHFAVQVDRFDEGELRAFLTDVDVEPGDVGMRYGAEGSGPSMYIQDPDGNVVELKGPPQS